MTASRRQFLALTAGAVALTSVCPDAMAQTYPSRPITMVVAFGAGGPSDIIARILAEGMRGSLGQPVVIENVPGASGTIGVGRVARAAPDGYTLVLGNWATHVLNGPMFALQYDLDPTAANEKYFTDARHTTVVGEPCVITPSSCRWRSRTTLSSCRSRRICSTAMS